MFDDELDASPEALAGRSRGARVQLGEIVLGNMLADWRAHGVATIARVREEKPDQYLRIFVAVLPRQTEIEGDVLDDLTDEELAAVLAAVREVVEVRAPRGGAAEPPPG
jgi:hypothetical protein